MIDRSSDSMKLKIECNYEGRACWYFSCQQLFMLLDGDQSGRAEENNRKDKNCRGGHAKRGLESHQPFRLYSK